MKKPTVTIGIPAYNEEANIGFLLQELLRQKQKNYKLEEILIASDGSKDKTVSVINKIQNKKVKVLDSKERRGTAVRQNQLLKVAKGDILVLINADIMIKDRNYIEKLVLPIVKQKSDLTATVWKELNPRNFFEEILFVSMKIKRNAFEKFNSGNNLYTCTGTARAFSKRLYKTLQFPSSIGEDAFSYLFCIYNKFNYQFVKNTIVYYRLPSEYKDHERQSIRFIQSKKKFSKLFGKDFVTAQYKIPMQLYVISGLQYLLKFPLHTMLYVFLYCGITLKSYFVSKLSDVWEISSSSKNLRYSK